MSVSVRDLSSSLSLYSFHTPVPFSLQCPHTHRLHVCRHCSVYIHTGSEAGVTHCCGGSRVHLYTQAPHKHYGMGESMKIICALEPINSVNKLPPTTKWFLLRSVNTHVCALRVVSDSAVVSC